MTNSESPAQWIELLSAQYENVSDERLLAALAALPPLADEADPRWGSKNYWHEVAYPFLAMADIAAKRRLKSAVRLLLERASFGDPGEIMRGLRHAFEVIYATDWSSLADEYLELARSNRLGTRLWAIDGLAVLNDVRAVRVFQESLRSDPEEIRFHAEIGLKRLLHPERISAEAEAARAQQSRARQERLDRQAESDAKMTDRRCRSYGKPMPGYRRTCKYCGVVAD